MDFKHYVYNLGNEFSRFSRFINKAEDLFLSNREYLDGNLESMDNHFKTNTVDDTASDKDKLLRFSEHIVYDSFRRMKRESFEFDEIFLMMSVNFLYSIFEKYFLSLIRHYYSLDIDSTWLGLTPEEIDVELNKKTTKFAYKSFEEQLTWIKQNIGLDLVTILPDHITQIIEFKATRNIIVHNDCVINNLYLKQVTASTFSLGDKRPLSIEYIENMIDKMADFLADFYWEVENKIK